MEIRGLDLSSTVLVRPVQTPKKAPDLKDTESDTVQITNNRETVSLSSSNPDSTQSSLVEEKDQVTAKTAELRQEDERASQARKKAEEEKKLLDRNFTKAYFAVDDNSGSVVIRIVDHEGKLIRQIPPEDYLKMLEAMDKNIESLFSTKA
ncbi:MAG: flagellar protein FlaG [Nitrospirae bacterium]|nr:flagellar protein FlaG [Nitrospirota bacterium]